MAQSMPKKNTHTFRPPPLIQRRMNQCFHFYAKFWICYSNISAKIRSHKTRQHFSSRLSAVSWQDWPLVRSSEMVFWLLSLKSLFFLVTATFISTHRSLMILLKHLVSTNLITDIMYIIKWPGSQLCNDNYSISCIIIGRSLWIL